MIQAAPAEDVPAQAAAYNTLGDCLRAANRPKDALLAYLHTDLLYSKDKEEHPRALLRSRSSSASSSKTAGPTNTPSGSGRNILAAPGYATRRRITQRQRCTLLPRERTARASSLGIPSSRFTRREPHGQRSVAARIKKTATTDHQVE